LKIFRRAPLFISLSRLPHVVLDIATPCVAALLWNGGFPSFSIVLIGLLTAFSGYAAVYALNDMVDYRVNRAGLGGADPARTRSLDSAAGRHPVATGRLSVRAGWGWVAGWGLAAMVGAWLLRPVCALIFLGGCLLEVLYCALYRVTMFRALVSGLVKILGAAAAVVAVDPHPSLPRLLLLLAMVFLWELGGQNIPSDWSDIEEDRRLHAPTIPLRLGASWATAIMIGCMTAAIALSVAVLRVFPGVHDALSIGAFLAAGLGLLIYPSIQLFLQKDSSKAALVFHAASFYPLALLAVVAVRILAERLA
jgi:4-hydroxybenzoate polyprenyltransferase